MRVAGHAQRYPGLSPCASADVDESAKEQSHPFTSKLRLLLRRRERRRLDALHTRPITSMAIAAWVRRLDPFTAEERSGSQHSRAQVATEHGADARHDVPRAVFGSRP
jgi:hypothetical protein